ncbi:MAG TPA: hypothetical protein VH762_12680 [Gemmatimonadaceae bacterium]
MTPSPVTLDRAERIARSHACTHCREYSFKRIVVRPAPKTLRQEFKAVWHATRVCGVCGLESELGIDIDGDLVYET